MMKWLTVTIPQAPAHKPVKCWDGKIYRNLWTAAGGSQKSLRFARSLETSAGGSQLCSVSTTAEALVGRDGEVTTDMSVDRQFVSVSVPQSVRNESETGGFDSLLSWNVTSLTVFVIMPVTLAGAVFVSLMAVKYFSKRFKLNSLQHGTKRKDGNRTGLFSRVPLLHTQLTADDQKPAGYANRSSDSLSSTQYHVYELID